MHRATTKRMFIQGLLLLSSLCGCATTQQIAPIRGTLVDSESNAPLQGGYVLLRWEAQIAHFPSSYSKCVHIAFSKSDTDGQFVVPGWELKTNVIDLSVDWVIYMPGYVSQSDSFVPSTNGKYLLTRFSGTKENWIRSVLLTRGQASCGGSESDATTTILFVDDLAQAIQDMQGGDLPVDIHGTMTTANIVLHQQKCLALWQAADAASSGPKDNSEIYYQCLKKR